MYLDNQITKTLALLVITASMMTMVTQAALTTDRLTVFLQRMRAWMKESCAPPAGLQHCTMWLKPYYTLWLKP